MGNTLPKEYLAAKNLTDAELLVELEKEVDDAYKNIKDIDVAYAMSITSCNVQVYVDRNSEKNETRIWLPKQYTSRLFDKFKRPYFARLASSKLYWVIEVYFLSCPTCDQSTS
jgi:hypothetical protein